MTPYELPLEFKRGCDIKQLDHKYLPPELPTYCQSTKYHSAQDIYTARATP